MWTAFLDLVTGAHCAGCAVPGRVLCADCARGLQQPATIVRPIPCPPGLVPVAAAGEYADLLRTLIGGFKEHRQMALAGPLADCLARAVAAARDHRGRPDLDEPLILVPVPSRSSTVRARGYDSTMTLTSAAARRLGPAVVSASLLRVGRVQDQAGLDASGRAANLAEAMRVSTPALARLARQHPRGRVIVCDDVVTTGATAREAQRALQACGIPVLAIATVAATRRRSEHGPVAMHRVVG